MKIVKRTFLILLIIIILILIYHIPKILTPIVKNKIHDYLEKTLRTDVQIGRAAISILTGNIIIYDLTIENPNQQDNILEARHIAIKLDLPSLLKKKFIITKVAFEKPKFVFHKSVSSETNWDFLWQKGQKKPIENIVLPVNEFLIKNGTICYIQELNPQGTATAEFHGIFFHLKNYSSPICYIQGTPLYTRVKGKGYIPTDPKGIVIFSSNVNLMEEQKSFFSNVRLEDISLIYFNNFYPEDSQIQVLGGRFSLIGQAQCIHDQLSAKPNVTVSDLKLKLTKDYTTGDVFELPVLLVVEFFDIYKDQLKFTFEVSGTLSDPKFRLREIIAQNASKVIGESIVRTISKSPTLITNLGDKLILIADKLKELGFDIGEGAVDAIKQLEKPVSEFIKGLKGE